MSDKQGKRFYQDSKTIEERYQGRLTTSGVSKWTKITLKHKRQLRKRNFFYHISNVHEGFISAVSLLNDLMKISLLSDLMKILVC